MTGRVYFIDMRATIKENFIAKIGRLMETAGISRIIDKRDLTAVKMHFGEMGNAAFIRPVYIRKVVEVVKQAKGVPFLTDANTLYAGTRSDAPHHLTTAVKNGFAYAVVEAPLIIADGLRGKSETAVPINQKRFASVYIGTDIVEADAFISVAHFKGHELSGFGGAVKNVGMGCASRKGKLAQHSGLSPRISGEQCIGCGECRDHCSQHAISMEGETAAIDADSCIGCGECILICPNEAITVQWNRSVPVFLEKMVEYALGVLKGKANKAFFINFITDVSPACDCYPSNDAPIVKNIGVVAATDPVAIDQASVDLVNAEPALAGTRLTTNTAAGEDKFKGIYPKVDWEIQLDYAEKVGLGSRTYELVKL
ncbi:4Fe-4S ferredoxin [Desulfosarcina alkanivorans]|uniref:4Fe-4S ferredoxin n=1 Tax=Desulfosarcina alkanivorans TaxID=571177 RepID=A0A5K7YXI0_9BACT|nr:DUF362 domain-containing protein [Desulfosarcina alkanivorans]BBO69387.1 4Fe-4S ferredoxin [Desulfosarcina alkanivorans]